MCEIVVDQIHRLPWHVQNFGSGIYVNLMLDVPRYIYVLYMYLYISNHCAMILETEDKRCAKKWGEVANILLAKLNF